MRRLWKREYHNKICFSLLDIRIYTQTFSITGCIQNSALNGELISSCLINWIITNSAIKLVKIYIWYTNIYLTRVLNKCGTFNDNLSLLDIPGGSAVNRTPDLVVNRYAIIRPMRLSDYLITDFDIWILWVNRKDNTVSTIYF